MIGRNLRAAIAGMASAIDLTGGVKAPVAHSLPPGFVDAAAIRRDFTLVARDVRRAALRFSRRVPSDLPRQERLFSLDEGATGDQE